MHRLVGPNASRVAGRHIDRSCSIIVRSSLTKALTSLITSLSPIEQDVKDIGLSQFYGLHTTLKDIVQIAQDHYPESTEVILVVNAPWLFATIWAAVSGWMDKATRDKVQILSGEFRSSILPVLLKSRACCNQ